MNRFLVQLLFCSLIIFNLSYGFDFDGSDAVASGIFGVCNIVKGTDGTCSVSQATEGTGESATTMTALTCGDGVDSASAMFIVMSGANNLCGFAINDAGEPDVSGELMNTVEAEEAAQCLQDVADALGELECDGEGDVTLPTAQALPDQGADPNQDPASETLEKLECKADELPVCSGALLVVDNPANDFEVICGDNAICQDLTLIVMITDAASVDNVEGGSCGDEDSCRDASFIFINNQLITPNVEKWDCGGQDACRDSTFMFTNFGDIEISCGNDRSCYDGTFTFNNVGVISFECDGTNSCLGCVYTNDGVQFDCDQTDQAV